MKKRLLITSIVMMLVVAVALSTATYAWFTSNANVTATTLSMTAAINEAPALEISYVNTEGTWLTTIAATSDTPEGGFKPAAPETLTLADPTAQDPVAGTYLSALTWKNATVVNGKFNNDVTQTNTNYVWHDNASHQSFFLHNASTANGISGITMTATIEGDAAPFIRIAVFKKVGSNFELYGVIANYVQITEDDEFDSGATYYTHPDSTTYTPASVTSDGFAAAVAGGLYRVGTVATGTVAANGTLVSTNISEQDICSVSVALGSLGVNNSAVGGADEMELKVVVWMDGSALNDDTAGPGTGTPKTGKVSSIALDFKAAR